MIRQKEADLSVKIAVCKSWGKATNAVVYPCYGSFGLGPQCLDLLAVLKVSIVGLHGKCR